MASRIAIRIHPTHIDIRAQTRLLTFLELVQIVGAIERIVGDGERNRLPLLLELAAGAVSFTAADAHRILSDPRKQSRWPPRIAYVVTGRAIGPQAMMFEQVATGLGIPLRIFAGVDPARAWLLAPAAVPAVVPPGR